MKKKVLLMVFLIVFLVDISTLASDTPFEAPLSDSSNSDWTMFQNDPQHSGYSTGSAPNSSEIKFMVKHTWDGLDCTASPIIIGERLIISGGILQHEIHAINATSGEFLWGGYTPEFSDGTPAAYGDRVVIPGSIGYLHCFNLTNGALIWKYYTGPDNPGELPSPIIYDGVVFHASKGGQVYGEGGRGSIFALSLFEMENATAPKLIWKKSLDSKYTTSPAYHNGKVFIGYSVGTESLVFPTIEAFVDCLNATDGRLVWSFPVGGYALHSSPTVVDEKVYTAAGKTVYCLNESSGESLWETSVNASSIYASPAVANDRLYIATHSGSRSYRERDYIITYPAFFYCLNASDGRVIWRYQLNTEGDIVPYRICVPTRSSAAVADGKVFLCAGRKIYAFNETSGEIVWSYEANGHVNWCSPAVAHNAVYMFDSEGYVYSFGTPEFYQLVVNSEQGNVEGAGFYRVGSNVTISVHSPTIVEPGVRYVFTGWTGEVVSNATTANITINAPRLIVTASWKKEYHLTVNSPFGNPQGEGWYDPDSTASYSVSSPDGFLVVHRFTHWVDDSTSSSNNLTMLMDGPKTVTAVWETDYSQLLYVLGIIGAATVISALILKHKRTGGTSSRSQDLQQQNLLENREKL